MRRPMTFERKPAIAKIERIMAILADGKPRRIAEIASEASMSIPGFREYLKKLRQEKKIRVCGYAENKYPIFTFGNQPDVKRKHRKSTAELSRESYHRLAKDPEFLMEQKIRQERRRLRNRTLPANVDIYATIFRRAA